MPNNVKFKDSQTYYLNFGVLTRQHCSAMDLLNAVQMTLSNAGLAIKNLGIDYDNKISELQHEVKELKTRMQIEMEAGEANRLELKLLKKQQNKKRSKQQKEEERLQRTQKKQKHEKRLQKEREALRVKEEQATKKLEKKEREEHRLRKLAEEEEKYKLEGLQLNKEEQANNRKREEQEQTKARETVEKLAKRDASKQHKTKLEKRKEAQEVTEEVDEEESSSSTNIKSWKKNKNKLSIHTSSEGPRRSTREEAVRGTRKRQQMEKNLKKDEPHAETMNPNGKKRKLEKTLKPGYYSTDAYLSETGHTLAIEKFKSSLQAKLLPAQMALLEKNHVAIQQERHYQVIILEGPNKGLKLSTKTAIFEYFSKKEEEIQLQNNTVRGHVPSPITFKNYKGDTPPLKNKTGP
jgi:hypothetical protein